MIFFSNSKSLALDCRRDSHHFVFVHNRFDETVFQLSSELDHVLFQNNATLSYILCVFPESGMQGLVENPPFIHHVQDSCHQNSLCFVDIFLFKAINDLQVIFDCFCLVFTFLQLLDLSSVDSVEQHDHQCLAFVFSFHDHQHFFNQLGEYFSDDFHSCHIQFLLLELDLISLFSDNQDDSAWCIIEYFSYLRD